MTPTRFVELDLRGNVCPGPTVDTLQALRRLEADEGLVVVCDYLPARQTIPQLVAERGWSSRIVEDDGRCFRMEIAKGGA